MKPTLLGRAARVWAFVEEGAAILLLVAMSGLVLLQVVGRYILTNPFIWTEEVTRLTLIWLTFVAAAAVTRRGLHIAVDMFLRPIPTRSRVLIAGATECVTAGTFVWMTILGARLAVQLGSMPLAATRWPMSVMIWPAAVGCGLIALYAGFRGIRRLWAGCLGLNLEAYAGEFDESIRS